MKRILLSFLSFTCFITISMAQNDCSSAIALPNLSGGGTHSVTATAITPGTSGGVGGGAGANNAAWFSFLPDEDGTLDVNSCNGGADTRLYIHDSCAGPYLANNDDACATGTGNNYASEVTGLSVNSGTTYYIEWDDRWSGNSFDWNISFTPLPPAAPDCPTLSSPTNASMDASLTANLTWTPAATGAAATSYDVYLGTVSGSLSLAGNTSSTNYVPSGLMNGTTYYWAVHPVNAAGSTDCSATEYSFTTEALPTNTDCANAEVLPTLSGGGSHSESGTTIIGSSAGGVGGGAGSYNAAWFSFTPAENGILDLNSCNGGEDTRVYLHDDCAGPALASDDDTCPVSPGGSSYASEISGQEVVSGNTYYIEWDDRWGSNPFDWSMTFTPACIAMNHISLNTSTVTSSAANGCDATDGWTYYEDASNPGNYVFGIDWGMNNNAAKAAATVTIQVDGTPNSAGDSDGGAFFMGRQWDVDLGGTSLVDPVSIRFFYDPAEKTAAENAAANHAFTYGIPDNGFTWFKMNGSVDFSTITDPAFNPEVPLGEDATGTMNGVTYVQHDGITSFSSGSGGASSGSTPLPVEFVSFDGFAKERTNVLEWSTATEINNSHFEIERSPNGEDFEKIGRVNGAGNAIEMLEYSFVDVNPLAKGYYRLKQVDFDGTYDYSEIISIIRLDAAISIGNVMPNPTKGITSIEFSANQGGQINLNIMNVNGQVVSQQSISVQVGVNTTTLDLNYLANGVYYITLSDGKDKATTRLVKTN